MKITPGFRVRGFILAAAFIAGLGFGTSASAQVQPVEHAFFIDLNSKTATDLGTVNLNFTLHMASMTPDKWWVRLSRLEAFPMLSSPAPTGQV